MRKNNRRGFTLIELLVVISIISLLSSIALSSMSTARMKAKNAKRMTDLKTMHNVIQLYMLDHNGAPPSTCAAGPQTTCVGSSVWKGSDAPTYIDAAYFTTNFVNAGYISSWPTDPLPPGAANRGTNDRGYLYKSDGIDYKILIYGTVEGGTVPTSNYLSRWPASCGGPQASYAVYSAGAACW